jgi:hypothetical protein
VLSLGFTVCHGGDADNFLWGIEDVRWAAADPVMGGGVTRASPQPHGRSGGPVARGSRGGGRRGDGRGGG